MPVTPVHSDIQDPHEAPEFQLPFLNISLATPSFSNTLFSGCPLGSAVCFLAPVSLFTLFLHSESFLLSTLSIYTFLLIACLSLKFPLKYHFFSVAFLLNTELVASLVSANIYFTSACTAQYYICAVHAVHSYPITTPKIFTYEVLMVSSFVLTYIATIESRTQYAFHRCLNLVWIFKG